MNRNRVDLPCRPRLSGLALRLLACGLLFATFHPARADISHAQADALLAEAARLAPASQAVEMNFSAVLPTQYSTLGNWSAVIPWTPHIPVSASLLPDGRLLTFASNQRTTFPDGPQFTYAAVWDPATGQFTEINNGRHDMFCGGLSLLQDGRLFVSGGNGINGTTALASLFDWRTNEWVPAQTMADGRWYNTSIALPSGEVLTAGGNGGGNGNGTIEQWNASSGWRRLSGINWQAVANPPIANAIETNWHPFFLVGPDGRVLHFGPHQALDWLNTADSGSMTAAGASIPGTHYPKQGAWAMYAPGKVLVTGGLTAINNGTVVNKAFTVDFNAATPVVTPAAPMANARSFANSVVLPNGEVMIVGGTSVGEFFSDAGTIFAPEIWNPATGQWRAVAEISVPRNYHSLAMLLPDGRVWSGGGGLSGDPLTDHQDAQVFTPPPLFNADGTPAARPQITAAPDRIGPGTVFTVNATPGVQYFSFIRMSSLTHSVSTDLRHVRFTHTVNAPGEYAVAAPASINVLTPGYWMMFAVDANGVWSVSRVVQVTNATLPVVTNPGQQSVMQGTAVSLPINASATGGTLSYSASGLPGGLSLNTGTGLISGTVTAAPGTYRSTILVTAAGQVSSVSFNWIVVLPNLGTGQIAREWWTGITGTTVASLTGNPAYPANPNGRDLLGSFEAPENWDDSMGQRVRGFLTVPVSGAYRFAIASDDQSSLRLSTNANPANAVEIASQPDWVEPRAWTWYSQQTSGLITLTAGTRYYIEAVMKEGNGGDHLAVGWQKPGDSALAVIAGTYLSPYLPVENATITWSFDEAGWNGTTGEVKATAASLFALHGTAAGGAGTTATSPALSGNPGTGLSAQFNGSSQSVVIPYNVALNPGDFTIAAWVRSDTNPGTARCVLASRDDSTSTKRGYGLWITADNRWQLRTGADTAALTGPAVTVGAWTHVAATFRTTNASSRAGVRRLFINGAPVAEDSGPYQLNTSKPLVIGAADSPGTAFFAGAVDEVTLHQAPLSQPDVLALRDRRHATSTVPTNQPPVITNPGNQGTIVGAVVSLPVLANDPENHAITFSAAGLPTGLTISPSSGVISGTAAVAGSFNVVITATDSLNAAASVSLTWIVSNGLTLQPIVATPKPVGTQTYTASASSGVNARFKWNFGDGTAETAWSASPTVSHAFTSPGRYLLTLTGTDDTGITVTSTFYQAIHATLTARKPAASSSIVFEDLVSGNDRVWCVNPDNNSVSAFDVVTRTRYAEITTGTSPRSLALAPDGRLWVLNADSASISIINTSTRRVVSTRTLARGSRPSGLVFDPAGTAAWVALEAAGRVLKLNPSTGAQLASTEVGGFVRHLSISADGARLYASRFVTPPVSGEHTATPVLTGAGGQVVVVGTAAATIERTIVLAPSTAADTSTSARGLPNYLGAAVISPDGLSAWVPSKQDNLQRGTLRDGLPLNHENSIRAIASRINLTAQSEDPASRIDFDNAGMPSAAAFDPWGIYVFTVLEASRDVVVVDAWSRREFLRFPAGRAPQGVVVSPDGSTVYVQNFMDRTVSVFNVSGIMQGGSTPPAAVATLNAITTERLTAQVLQGKKLFYDALDPRLALQAYMSCASCHNDGGHDGRVWDLTGFGEGLRSTITLKGHGSHGTLHWTGNFDEVQDFEGQIRGLAGGTGLIGGGTPNAPLGAANAGRSTDLDALAAYVKSLTTNGNSPLRTSSGALSTDATAGQQIFRTLNCAACHSGANFSSSALNVFANIGTLKPSSGLRLGQPLTGLDVPTLRGLWATAPYLHDGSAATLTQAITAHPGVTLSAADMTKLVAFVSSIDDAPASAPLPFAVVLSTASTSVTGAFNVTVVFNAAASGFTLSDVVATNGVASNLTGSGTTFTFRVTPSASGVVTVNIPANAATDSTALGNLASNTLAVNYGVTDTTPPSVVLATPSANVMGPFVVTATFSENVTGLLASEFIVTNGSVAALSSSGAVWSATIMPAAPGAVTVRLPAGVALDAAGNASTASNTLGVNYSAPDTTPPSVVLSTPSDGVSGPFVVTASFSESVSGLLASEFAVTNGTVTALSAAGAVWSATVTPIAAGTVAVVLPANAAQDAANNGNLASNTVTLSYTPPVVTTGLTAAYHIGKNFEQPVLSRVDANVDFTWSGAPAAGLPADGFSVRWQGSIVPAQSGVFDFITRSDDGVRLWLNGVRVINNWTDHGETWDYATITLTAGVPVPVKMEFYENSGGAMARLFWDGPGANFVPVPQSALRPLPGGGSGSGGLGGGSSPAADDDGVPDLLEQALGTSSTSGISQAEDGLQLVSRDQNAVDATVLRPAGQGGVVFVLETSSDLVNWAPLAVTPSIANAGNGRERVTWPNLHALSGQSLVRGIIRLRVTQDGGGTAVSPPVGWQSVALRPGTQSFGANVMLPAVFTGPVSGATASGITVNEQAQLAAVIDPARRHFIEIISGPHTGHRFDVQGISATACVIVPDSPDNTTALNAVDWNGVRVQVRPHLTLGGVFDPTRFQGSNVSAGADQVLFYSANAYITSWLFASGTERRWVLDGDATLDSMNDMPIPPGTGLMLKIASATPQPLLLTGSVRTTAFARPLAAGYHLVANPWPLDLTPAQAGLTSDAFVATASPASADQFQLWKGDATASASGYLGYWFFQMPGQLVPIWAPAGSASLPSQNDTTLLKAGRATFIKAQNKANRPVWIVPAP